MMLIATAVVLYRVRAAKFEKKKAIEAARVSSIKGHLQTIKTNEQRIEKDRQAAALNEMERLAAKAAAEVEAAKAADIAKLEAAKSKQRESQIRADLWGQLAVEFKVHSGSGVFPLSNA
jgi:flagellar motor protein MotB